MKIIVTDDSGFVWTVHNVEDRALSSKSGKRLLGKAMDNLQEDITAYLRRTWINFRRLQHQGDGRTT